MFYLLFAFIFTGLTSKQPIAPGLACIHEEQLNLSFFSLSFGEYFIVFETLCPHKLT